MNQPELFNKIAFAENAIKYDCPQLLNIYPDQKEEEKESSLSKKISDKGLLKIFFLTCIVMVVKVYISPGFCRDGFVGTVLTAI
ncbi:MAG TPA: hypothetical protein ENJ95_07160 [Bacteroidetes bacterium]|nr:hypothetical protein [Bacteroidota bacterium]